MINHFKKIKIFDVLPKNYSYDHSTLVLLVDSFEEKENIISI